MKVTIDVEPCHQAYVLAFQLTDYALELETKAMRWHDKDAVYDQMMQDSKFFLALAKAVGKQAQEQKPDEGIVATPGA